MDTYVPAIPGIDWADMQAFLILSDAEEEAGNEFASLALRWIVAEKKAPVQSVTRIISSKEVGTTYDWYREKEEGFAQPGYSTISNSIFDHLPLDPDINYRHYQLNVDAPIDWRAYRNLHDAYVALISACIHTEFPIGQYLVASLLGRE